jgi:hypothetical protein
MKASFVNRQDPTEKKLSRRPLAGPEEWRLQVSYLQLSYIDKGYGKSRRFALFGALPHRSSSGIPKLVRPGDGILRYPVKIRYPTGAHKPPKHRASAPRHYSIAGSHAPKVRKQSGKCLPCCASLGLRAHESSAENSELYAPIDWDTKFIDVNRRQQVRTGYDR